MFNIIFLSKMYTVLNVKIAMKYTIKKEIKNAKNIIGKAIKKGLIDIVVGAFFRNFILYILTILIARMASKDDMAVMTYAQNIVGFVIVINGLGSIGAFLQFASASNSEDYRNRLYKKILKTYIPVELLLAFGIIIYRKSNPQIFLQFCSLAFMPLFAFISELSFSYLRASMNNKIYSRFSVLYASIQFIIQIGGYLLFGIIGASSGRTFSYLLSSVFIVMYLQRRHCIWDGSSIRFKLQRAFVSFAFYAVLSNVLLGVGPYLNLWVVGFMANDLKDVAYYKVASVLPNGLVFIPAAFAIFFYPYFSRNKNNIKWVKRNSFLTITAMIFVCGIIGIILFYFSPWILHMLYKGKYDSVVEILRILSISFILLGALRVTTSNIVLALGKARFNMVRGAITLCLQIILDFSLYYKYGIIGIALAELGVNIISGIINIGFLVNYNRRKV